MSDHSRLPPPPHRRARRRRARRRRAARDGLATFAANPIGLVGLGIILFYGALALLHPVFMNTVWRAATPVYHPVIGYDPPPAVMAHPSPPTWLPADRLPETSINRLDRARAEQPLRHILGTDPQGRDVLSQLMKGAQAAFVLGIGAALITVVLATTTGAVAAYFGGFVDALLMRLADLLLMMPGLPLLIVLSSLFEFRLWHLALVLGVLSGFGGQNITIKAQALTITVKTYIDAARVAGGGHAHIIFTHLVPNLLPLAFLYMMTNVTTAIFSEAALSFLGLISVRTSWGVMIATARAAGRLLDPQYWYLMLPAGVSITLLCSAFYLVGRALDEVVNPRLRR